MTITFYDLDSSLPERALMPNPFKIRIALAYKGIPFTTEWAEWNTLTDVLKAINAPPSFIAPDGEEKYTSPTIFDSTTGKVITESAVIAQYLDDTYPNTPKLFPPDAKATIMEFTAIWQQTLRPVLLPFSAMGAYNKLNVASQDFFRNTREKILGCKLEELMPEGKRPEQLQKLKDALSKMAKYYEKDGVMRPFCLGDTFSFADCDVGGYLMFAKRGLKAEEWAAVTGFDGGHWGRMADYYENLPNLF